MERARRGPRRMEGARRRAAGDDARVIRDRRSGDLGDQGPRVAHRDVPEYRPTRMWRWLSASLRSPSTVAAAGRVGIHSGKISSPLTRGRGRSARCCWRLPCRTRDGPEDPDARGGGRSCPGRSLRRAGPTAGRADHIRGIRSQRLLSKARSDDPDAGWRQAVHGRSTSRVTLRRSYPFLVIRDAYGVRPYGPDNYRRWAGAYLEFSKEGFIFVYQDVRGRWKSEGEFVHHQPYVRGGSGPTSTTDMYDTAEWLLANVPNHNGRISQRGVSWTGWEAAMGMIDAHPAIRLSSPQAPPQDQFLGDDYHSGGAFQLAYAFHWVSENARRRPVPTESCRARVRLRHAGRIPVLSGARRGSKCQKVFWRRHPSLRRADEPRHL